MEIMEKVVTNSLYGETATRRGGMNIFELCGQCCKKQREKTGLTQKQISEEYPHFNLNRIKYLEGGRCATYQDYAMYMYVLTDSPQMVQDFFAIMADASDCCYRYLYPVDPRVLSEIRKRIKDFCEKYAIDVEVEV